MSVSTFHQKPTSAAKRVGSQTWFETMAILRHGEQLLISIVIPIVVLLALIHTSVLDNVAKSAGVSKVQLATPGVLALCIMSSAFTGQAIATAFDRRYGVLKYLATTPIGRSGLLMGKVCAVFIVALIQLIVISIIAIMNGWHPVVSGIPYAAISVILGVAAFTSLGLLMGGTLRAEATLALANLIFVLLVAVGGLIYPSSMLPPVLRWFSEHSPSGALGDALRVALEQGQASPYAWIVLLVWIIVCTFGCVKFFKWQ
ncbi:MAG: ABC transporter permease [Micrococcaceae bacterium]